MGDPKKKSCDKMDGTNFGKTGGIINGAKWYSVRGGLQDFNYLSSNDFEITLELGCQKYPAAKDLEKEWNNNRNALLNFMYQVRELFACFSSKDRNFQFNGSKRNLNNFIVTL